MSSLINSSIIRITGNSHSSDQDLLAVEEPLEIHLSFVKDFQRQESNLSVTMRTPGNDKELALGFLFTEGIFENLDQVLSVKTTKKNIITVVFRDDVNFDLKKLEKHFYTSSSCGVCGKSSIEAINTIKKPPNQNNTFQYKASLIYKLPLILRQKQNIFEQTGGLHASAIFDLEGKLILMNEDVGRHNALDKLIGSALQNKLLQLENYLLLLSGRASFELIQKATMAGISIVAAIGAPSSLAVELAIERGMTLIGFLRNEKFNIYSGKNRIKYEA